MSTTFTSQGLAHEHSKDCSHRVDEMGSLKDVIEKVLRDHAVESTANQGLHGWRCQYPQHYGDCRCFQELVDALDKAVAKA